MADTTVFGSSFGIGVSAVSPAKRRRVEALQRFQTPSEIKDNRIIAGQGLRLDCDFITVRVGTASLSLDSTSGESTQETTQETFKVHEHALCDRSEFFANAMKPEWASMRDDPRVIDLPDDDPEAFALYRTWLYSGKLPILASDPNDDDSQIEHYRTLAYAYVLGERLLDIPFKNAIADAYVLYARGIPPAKRFYPSNDEIRIIYEGTGESSPIRKLLVDIWCCRGRAEWLNEDADLPKEFLIEVVRRLLASRTNVENISRPWKTDHEQYHENERAVSG